MQYFKVYGKDRLGNDAHVYYSTYDGSISTELRIMPIPGNKPHITSTNHGTKSTDARFIIIQLGLSCNYECGYCSQRYIPFDEAKNLKDSQGLLDKLSNFYKGGTNGTGEGTAFQFWGGEPFVYWKTLRPLVEELRHRFPKANFQITSNGSLWNEEKIDWAIKNQVHLTMSHDGPNQSTRAEKDVLNNPEILSCVRKLNSHKLLSFNPIIYKQNQSRVEIYNYFYKLFGDDFELGNSEFIRPYDEQGYAFSLQSAKEHIDYRKLFFSELVNSPEKLVKFSGIMRKMAGFASLQDSPADVSGYGSHCGMERETSIAVNLQGDVITCMNTNIDTPALTGKTHKLGNIDNISEVRLDTIKHWSERDLCSKCPVLPICRGACMFQDGEDFNTTCNHEFSDHIPLLAATIYNSTGILPYYLQPLEYDIPADRKDIFGMLGEADTSNVFKKIINIKAI